MMDAIIGCSMVVAMFVALFCWSTLEVGFREALIIFASVGGLVAWMFLAFRLIA